MTGDKDKLREALEGWRTGNYGHMEASQAHELMYAAARLVLDATPAAGEVEAAAAAIEGTMRTVDNSIADIARIALTAAAIWRAQSGKPAEGEVEAACVAYIGEELWSCLANDDARSGMQAALTAAAMWRQEHGKGTISAGGGASRSTTIGTRFTW